MKKLNYGGADKFKIRASQLITAIIEFIESIPSTYQGILTPGNGIAISDDNVISADLGLTIVDGQLCVQYESEDE